MCDYPMKTIWIISAILALILVAACSTLFTAAGPAEEVVEEVVEKVAEDYIEEKLHLPSHSQDGTLVETQDLSKKYPIDNS